MSEGIEFLQKVLFTEAPIEERIATARQAILTLDAGVQQAYSERLDEIEELLDSDGEDEDEQEDIEETIYWNMAVIEEELGIETE